MTSRTPIFIAKQFRPCLLTFAAFTFFAALTAQLAVAEVEVVASPGTNNVAVSGQVAFAAAGTQGVVIVDLDTRTVADVVPSPPGTNSIDDVSIDGDLLFVLDGAGAGALSVFSIKNPMQPTLVSGPVAVAVGPFAGVSAANGRVVVSGGTGLLSLRSYGVNGTLGGPVLTIDLGVGQPDVLVADDGDTGFVSTDFSGFVDGQSFGITVIDISVSIMVVDQIGIAGAGFSPGTDGPANFPIESAIQGDTLFVASGNGISVFDVSDPGSVQTIGQIPLSTNPVNVDVHNDTLFVVGNSPSPTLTVIDVADLSSPVAETISLPSGGRPLGVAATSSSVVIADANLGILVDSLFLPGDLNGDGAVNLLDVAPFVELLGSGRFQIEGDINGDGIVNLLDVTPFVELLGS